jgi:hypothetical protein
MAVKDTYWDSWDWVPLNEALVDTLPAGQKTLANGRTVRTVWLYDNTTDKMRRTVVVYEVNNPNPAPPLAATNVRLGAPANAVTKRLVSQFEAL